MEGIYDFAVIGGGPAGLAGAMYAGRLGLKAIVFGDIFGGTITLTDFVENYPGFKKITGGDLGDAFYEHAEEYGVEFIEDLVVEVENELEHFILKTEDGNYNARTVLFATGMKHRKLDAPGVEEYEKKGVYYCALCDGPLYKGKVVAVIGGSDSAAKEALLLTQYAEQVYMIYRGDKIRPEPVNAKRIKDNDQITVITNTNVTEVRGDDTVKSVILDRAFEGKDELELDAVFMAIGGIPQSELAKNLGIKVNEKKEIIIDRNARTNIEGVYGAGDVVDTVFKQAITGAAEGVLAAYSAYELIKSKAVY